MVVPTVSDQEKIEAIVAELHGQDEFPYSSLCELMFAVIDRFCECLPAQTGPGRRKSYSDHIILKIDMLMHLTGKRGETEILREIKRHYREYFDRLPGQSRLWHRIRQALPLIERFRRYLGVKLGLEYEDIRILDTCPIPVALSNSRPGRGNGFDRADGGYCASKQLKYLGFKLGLLITPQGIPDVYDLFSARPHDVQFLDDLLSDAYDIVALGDKGFVTAPKRALLADEQNVLLITYRRCNQKMQNSSWEQWALNTYRQLIETVFSQLDGHMHIQRTGAKTDLGLVKRVMGIITAFTLGIYLNFLLGRNLLAIKALFA
jgi:hypothetical protein